VIGENVAQVDINYTDLINGSMEWTKTILFRPFKLKKWFMLLVIAALAFQLQGGCNSNIDIPAPREAAQEKDLKEDVEDAKSSEVVSDRAGSSKSPFVQISSFYNRSTEKIGKPAVIAIIIFIVLAIFLLLLLLNWIYSTFYFIYMHAITSNDASIKAPFRENKMLGWSYFLWNTITSAIFLSSLALITKLTHFALVRIGALLPNSGVGAGKIALTVVPFGLIGFLVILCGGLLGFFITDCVCVIMFKKKLSILKAIPLGAAVLRGNILNFFLYGLIKLGLSILGSIIVAFVGFFVGITLIVPLVAVGALGVFLIKIMPGFLKPVLAILGAVFGVLLLMGFSILMNLVFLPLSVFFKTFNIKFIGRLNPEYSLFKF